MRKPSIVLALFVTLAVCGSTNEKFRHWFPGYKTYFSELLDSQVCAKELNNYWTINRTECWSTCSCVVDCLLEHTIESVKLNMASAAILLGLTPSLLALMGPSVSELSTLSARFPLLAVMLGLASPAINPLQLFSGPMSSKEVLAGSTSVLIRAWYGWWEKKSSTTKMMIHIAQFVLVAGMLANTISVSIHLDLRSTSSWRCGQMYMPLIWSMLSIVPHALAIVAVRLREPNPAYEPVSPEASHDDEQPSLGILRRTPRGMFTQSRNWRTCINAKETMLGETLTWLASLAGIIHMIFGVLVFSALVFVPTIDALPILLRYALSAGICQAILLVELAFMRLDREQKESNDEGGLDLDELVK